MSSGVSIPTASRDLQSLKKGNQELENRLRYLLSDHADFEFQKVKMDGETVGVMTIKAAENLPVAFEKQEYIRIGSYTKQLKEFPAVQARLWNKLQNKDFELSPELTEQLILSTPKGVKTEVLITLYKYYIANKQDNTDWVILPVTNFDAYFGTTAFGRRYLQLLKETNIIETETSYGVCRYKVNRLFSRTC
mgnify:CR=1 FL=1